MSPIGRSALTISSNRNSIRLLPKVLRLNSTSSGTTSQPMYFTGGSRSSNTDPKITAAKIHNRRGRIQFAQMSCDDGDHSINIHLGGTTTGSHAGKKLVLPIGSPHLIEINPLECYLTMIMGKRPAWHPIGEKRKQVSARPGWHRSGQKNAVSCPTAQ
jgi:hypothetical protein